MDLIKFFEVTNILKRLPRTGWLVKGIKDPESIAAHSFSTTLMALILGIDRDDINLQKLLIMSILHDISESQIGDLTPSSIELIGGNERKKELEKKATKKLFELLDEKKRTELFSIYEQYINNETKEAKFLHQIDKLEMLFQAVEYQRAGYPKKNLNEFWSATESITDKTLAEILAYLKRRYR
ncbi:HD family hydrolase [Candidatus Borrarchaeum sp.]|uniref:HD domain-containing protein n=1 Tax=Candidatus Borrarchaeum sp. TaxID=2846742 RepID=UPI00257F3CF8|nr:HD family hydrolase [Candidatus Borrarchaeum sp.]